MKARDTSVFVVEDSPIIRNLGAATGFDVLEAMAINEGRPPMRIVLTNYVT